MSLLSVSSTMRLIFLMSLFRLVIGNNATLIDEFKLEMMNEFETTNQNSKMKF
jgi:hypothetical protein